MANNITEELLTIQQAAKLLNIKPVTLRKWDREGKIKTIRIGTRGDRRFNKNDLLDLLKKPKSEVNWQEYIRSGMVYLQTHPAIQGLFKYAKKNFDVEIKNLIAYFEEGTLYWHYTSVELENFGRRATNLLLGSAQYERGFFDCWNKKSQELLNLIDQNQELGKIAKNELIKLTEKQSRLLSDWYGWTICIDGMDESLGGEISDNLKQALPSGTSKKEFILIFNGLSQSRELSYLSQARKKLLELGLDVHLGKIKKGGELFQKKLEEYLNQYWWIELGWDKDEPIGKSKVAEQINEILSDIKSSQKELQEILTRPANVAAEKKKVVLKYRLKKNNRLMALLNLNEKLIYYHDYRKEVQMKANFWQFKLYGEIAKRYQVPEKLLYWLEPEELQTLLKTGKMDENEINQRSHKFLVAVLDGRIEKLSGKDASHRFAELLKKENEEVRDLQGMSACDGRIIGRAFVALHPKQALEIGEGDILVTGMTTPDFVPAIKKSAGLVTDEGGMTCHAAIISRELNKPCIVGTKQATRLIKTGDLILVAANHGVVRILKQT